MLIRTSLNLGEKRNCARRGIVAWQAAISVPAASSGLEGGRRTSGDFCTYRLVRTRRRTPDVRNAYDAGNIDNLLNCETTWGRRGASHIRISFAGR